MRFSSFQLLYIRDLGNVLGFLSKLELLPILCSSHDAVIYYFALVQNLINSTSLYCSMFIFVHAKSLLSPVSSMPSHNHRARSKRQNCWDWSSTGTYCTCLTSKRSNLTSIPRHFLRTTVSTKRSAETNTTLLDPSFTMSINEHSSPSHQIQPLHLQYYTLPLKLIDTNFNQIRS